MSNNLARSPNGRWKHVPQRAETEAEAQARVTNLELALRLTGRIDDEVVIDLRDKD